MKLLLLLIAAALIVGFLFQFRSRTAAPAPQPSSDLPEHLDVRVKAAFFSKSEQQVYLALQNLTGGTPYAVFPNVRLNDIFEITSRTGNAYARLRDKHVDFLIVSRHDWRPLLGLEIDGTSHDSGKQKKRDQVKDVAFRSAGLPLLRLDSRQGAPDQQSLRQALDSALPNLTLDA